LIYGHGRFRNHDWFYQTNEPIYFPPIFPIPGDNREHETYYAGVSWPEHPLLEYVGLAFPALCRFWSIMQEVAAVYWTKNDIPLPDRASLAFAEAKYQKLLAWSDMLPEGLAAQDQTDAVTLLFQ